MKTYNCGAVAVEAEKNPELARGFDNLKKIAKMFVELAGAAVIKDYVGGVANLFLKGRGRN